MKQVPILVGDDRVNTKSFKVAADSNLVSTLVLVIILLLAFMRPTMASPPLKVTVVEPNGGEIWFVDNQYLITWFYSKTPQTPVNVTLSYSMSGKHGPYAPIDQIVDPDGASTSYQWTVPDTPSDNCYVMVEIQDAGGAADSDESHDAFSVKHPSIMVDPESIVDRQLEPGKSFTVSIITDYPGDDASAYEFTLSYNPNVLHGVNVTNGDLIVGGSASFKSGTFDNTAGTLSLTCAFFFSTEVASGPGTLANVTFTVVATGSSNMTLGDDTRLIEYNEGKYGDPFDFIDARIMPNRIQHGFFSNGQDSGGNSAEALANQQTNAYVQTNELATQAETSLFTLHLAIPEVIMSWYPWAGEDSLEPRAMLVFKDAVKPGERGTLQAGIAIFAVKNELAKIGINVEVHIVDKHDWGLMINLGDYHKTYAEGGWDMALLGFNGMPTDLIGYESMFTAGGAANIFDWNNTKADYLLETAMSEFDPLSRKTSIDMWQKEFMHDPPMIPLYYLEGWDVVADDLEGWDPVVGWHDGWNLSRQNTAPEDPDVTVLWGSRDCLYDLNPLFAWTGADCTYAAQTFEALYKLREDDDPDTEGGYKVVPCLASGYPSYSLDYKTVTVHLRQNVAWHTNEDWTGTYYLNNGDVKWTFDTLMNFGYGKYADIIDSVDDSGTDPYEVTFHLKKPYPAFESLLSETYILPGHVLNEIHQTHGYDYWDWKLDPTNIYPNNRMLGTGPFKLASMSSTGWEMVANEDYWNWNTDPMVDRITNVRINWAPAGWGAMLDGSIDFGDCWTTVREVMQDVVDGNVPGLKALPDYSPTLDYLAFNLHHPKLSNRYVRQAIAQAINYPLIFDNLIHPYPYNAHTGRAPVFPRQQYTREDQTVCFFNNDLLPYEYNIANAQAYMDRWQKSQVGYTSPYPGGIYLEGAAGDADFSGKVDLDDFYIWRDEGWPLVPPDTVQFLPGQDKDPDFNNDGNYYLNPDYPIWYIETYGLTYPFPGAR